VEDWHVGDCSVKKLAALFFLAGAATAHADGFGGAGFEQLTLHSIAPGPSAPVNIANAEVTGLDYPNNGVSVALSGNSTTLSANVGQWANSPLSFSCNWHTVDAPGTSLGTSCTSFTIASVSGSAALGHALQVDVKASNLAGNATVTSHWWGPLSTTVPVFPTFWECTSIVSGVCQGNVGQAWWSPPPGQWLENGHAIANGCTIPPAVPANTATTGNPAHVWYIDPVHGTTQAAGATGHFGSAFDNVRALTTSQPNYAGSPLFGFGRTIVPGDTIYLEPGTSAQYGTWSATGFYSTVDGTPATPTVFTWIMGDPAFAARPVLGQTVFNNGGPGGNAGFLIRHVGFENNRNSNSIPGQFSNGIVIAGGTAALPTYDMILEDICATGWLGHCNDPLLPSHYPTSGGTSDGTVVTASPVVTGAAIQDPSTPVITGAGIGQTVFSMSQPPLGFYYAWSNCYFRGAGCGTQVSAPSTGMPNGTIVKTINGITKANYNNSNGAFGFPPTVANFAALPSPPPNGLNAVYTTTNNNNLNQWNGTSWTALGTPTITLGPCDPVADAPTGCPTTDYPGVAHGVGSNVPNCDPFWTTYVSQVLTPHGGCSGTPTAWAGSTKDYSAGEGVTFTDAMVITPTGYFNVNDWSNNSNSIISISGGTDAASSQDPTQPNHFVGTSCVSVKDSSARYSYTGISDGSVSSVVNYHNFIKFMSGDAMEPYSVHRLWNINNKYSDPTEIWAHQDYIQHGSTGGGSVLQNLFNNADIENEGYEQNDPSNYFIRSMQGINYTENISIGGYYADNDVYSTTNGLNITGQWNVVIHNGMFGKPLGINNQTKGQTPGPLHGLLANNVANGVSRYSSQGLANFCTTDGTTQLTNLSIPFAPVGFAGGNSQVSCSIPGNIASGATVAGMFVGLAAWSQTEWRTNQAGISSLFTQYDPIAPQAYPNPGFNQNEQVFLSPCAQNSWPATANYPTSSASTYPAPIPSMGPCPAGVGGIIDSRPNPSFTGTSAAAVANVLATAGTGLLSSVSVPQMPNTGTLGDQFVLQADQACSNSTGLVCLTSPNAFSNLLFPAGLYTRNSGTTTTLLDWGASAGFELDSTAANFGTTCASPAAVAITGNPTITCPSANILSWSPTKITGIITGPHEPFLGFSNVTVTTNVGGTVPSASMTSASNNLIGTGAALFNPGLKGTGTALTLCGAAGTISCEPWADLIGKPFDPTHPSIGPIQ
jgi:hypothetical protein